MDLAYQKEEDINDRVRFNAASMSLFQAINSSIDLGDELISQCKFKIPMDYKETFDVISDEGAISEDILKKLKEIVYYRNLIAHEYYRINKEQLIKLVRISKILYEYLRQIKIFIQDHSET